MVDIHNYNKRYTAAIKSLSKYPITERNKELIREYLDDRMLDGLSIPRQIKYIEIIKKLAEKLDKNLDKVTVADMKEWARWYETANYTPQTKVSTKAMVKRFFKWLKQTEDCYPPEVKWLKTALKRQERITIIEKDLITEQETLDAIEQAKHPRDKALISVIAESGARIGEIGNLQVKHVNFDKHGTVLNVNGKTGPRRIRIIASTRHLLTWINMHPLRDNPEAPLWLTQTRESGLCYASIVSMLKRTFKRTGTKKKIHPHLFRHSRASYMARHMTEFQMNQYFGWVQGSEMPSTYVHMSGKDLDSAILKLNGFQVSEEVEESIMQPRICPRCEAINTPTSKYCCTCSGTIDATELINEQKIMLEKKHKEVGVNDLMKELLKDTEVAKLLVKKIAEMGLGDTLGTL